MVVQKLVVFGGNGFLGKRICQQAVLSGMQVIGLSRSGKSPEPVSKNDSHWIKEVSWQSANIFNPDSYVGHLKDGTPDIVHSIGILLENENYKKNIKNGFSIGDFCGKSSNPLFYPRDTSVSKPKDPDFTYERMNTKSAMILTDTYNTILRNRAKPSSVKPSISYISADKGFAMIPDGYIHSKRMTELYLLDEAHKNVDSPFRPIIIRPGFMFDELNTAQFNDFRTLLHDGIEVLNFVNKLILRKQFQFVNELIRPTVSTQQVGRSLVAKIKNQKFNGIVTLDDMLK
ncbi:hypothetical protein C6P45_001752 [Maudiozyma exigua]|uniref:NAD-dependent epimerase/dehydratase domain-containing protein n=1 Tax=Maudiozyma exigua TaxID=34358 RepID=A0A9P7B5U7_MAUEX|nr:hypothetical protein C6P45_001752 [Kazachstania exigua]